MKCVYLFSGLGADHRVFQYLDLPNYTVIHIKWIERQKNETLEHYAKRLAKQITAVNPIFIGLSFGGMVAIEVAKIVSTEKIVLISSAKTYHELPPYFRQSGSIGLQKIIPVRFAKYFTKVNYWLFGVESDRDKKLLKAVLKDTDAQFSEWAIDKIATWKNETVHTNLHHIHGKGDRILPCRFITCDHTIEDGGHFMIVNRAEQISELVRSILD